MSLDWTLEYDSADDGTYAYDLTDYVLSIEPIQYQIDTRTEGFGVVTNIVIDDSASNYGTNKYKLSIGSDYIILSPPLDGIETMQDHKISITLIDHILNSFDRASPVEVSGEAATTRVGGATVNIGTVHDFKTEYTSGRNSFDIEGFTEWDSGTHEEYRDGNGNYLRVYQPDYSSKGMLAGDSGNEELGNTFVKEKDIFDDLATAEGFSTSIINGIRQTEVSNTYNSKSLPTDCYRVWDCKTITVASTKYVVILYTNYDSGGSPPYTIRATSYKLSDWSLVDTHSWATKDYNEETGTGSDDDYIAYLMFPDYWNNRIYVPMWYCDDYSGLGGTTNTYNLILKTLTLDPDGNITESTDTTATTVDITQGDRSYLADNRNVRFYGTRMEPNDTYFHQTYIYNDDTAHNLVYLNGETGDVTIWDCEDTTDNTTVSDVIANGEGCLVPNRADGIVYIINQSTEKMKYVRVDMNTVSAAYAFNGHAGTLAPNDDSSSNSGAPCCSWREQVKWTESFPDSTYHYYYVPQGFNGIISKEQVMNGYISPNADYFSNIDGNFTQNFSGNQFDPKNDIGFWWEPNTDPNPSSIDMIVNENFVTKRLYLYQHMAYDDRKQQFIDAMITFGYFYQQINGNIRLIRINQAGTNIGTIDDILIYRKVEGFDDFADVWVLYSGNRNVEEGSGDKSKDVKTKIGYDYAWISADQLAYYIDWTDRINRGQAGIIIDEDLEEFYTDCSTRMPYLGIEFTYDGTDYTIIGVEIDIENWIIKVKGIEEIT